MRNVTIEGVGGRGGKKMTTQRIEAVFFGSLEVKNVVRKRIYKIRDH